MSNGPIIIQGGIGAGIPLKIPGVLDRFVQHEPATYPLHVSGALANEVTTDDRRACRKGMPALPAVSITGWRDADHRVNLCKPAIWMWM